MLGVIGRALLLGAALWGAASADFVNFESAHVHPLDLSPDRSRLAACNTADNRIEIYTLATGTPRFEKSIPVGLDPVSVRWASNSIALVANHISDTVSVVNVSAGAVTFAIEVPDEPCDVVTAGPAGRAFVTCQQENKIAVINYLGGQLTEILTVDAENPRALAVSADRTKVYAAVFESGNRTTILAGGADNLSVVPFPNSVVSEPAGPHGGQNPPPNDGPVFFPLKNPGNGAPPAVGLIVKETPEGWVDDTGANWDAFVSGPMAGLSGRPQGWQLLDHDIVVIDAANLSVSYVDSLMNINMAIAVHPQTGMVNVVGTEAINHIRFEPVVNGIFARVMMATASNTTRTGLVDLNADHLAEAQSQLPGGGDDPYARPRVPPAARARSIGDPRGIAWNSTGTLAFITGMGSNNMIVVNADGQRVHPDIPLREGPTGVVVDDMRGQVYALNRFHGSISVVSTQSFTETANVRFYDPTPEVIRRGRRHLYDTHKTSGLGHVSCATCHVDARFDRLAWDLGDPAGQVKDVLDIGFGGDLNLGANIPLMDPLDFDNFHPMKGPMTTQTLIGIIGHEPHHWRGDRLGLEEFNPAFMGLLGDDAQLTPQEMQEFEDFLATIHFPPNPYRNLDNSLPDNLPLEGHYATGDNNLPEGTPLPNGNAVNGLFLYRGAPGLSGIPTRQLDQQAFTCVICHTLPSGDGTNARYNGAGWTPIPRDPLTNAAHVAMVSIDGSTNRAIKVPHLQPVYEKTGFSMVNRNGDKTSLSGFGYLHDGSIDSIERFFAAGGPNGGAFRFQNDQEVADMVAFMLCFSGDDFVETPALQPLFNPPGNDSPDVHAAVGTQISFRGTDETPLFGNLVQIDDASARVDLVLMGAWMGTQRGFLHIEGDSWAQDENGAAAININTLIETRLDTDLLTFTVVPGGSGHRIALDRDGDGYLNYTEVLDGSNPADPTSFGPQPEGEGQAEGEGAPEGEGMADGEGGEEGEADGQPEGEGQAEGALEGEGSGDEEGQAEGEGEAVPPFHSADRDNNFSIDLSELLRTIQLYNANGYRCRANPEPSEDPYRPGFGDCSGCAWHTADYDGVRCRISLSELLRLVQIFNLRSYHLCDAPEYFCPGQGS